MSFYDFITSPRQLLSAELRPPRMGQSHVDSMDAWFSMHAALQELAAKDTMIFLTDGAVGTREEENLHHLVTNLDEGISRANICPFLTTKHSLEYCLWYAARAVEAGCGALTVLGGDKGGAPRCVPHGYLLRQMIRARFPDLRLGGWANPHHDARTQASFLTAAEFTADFYLTQLVSHLELEPVRRFLDMTAHAGIEMPGIFGVFFYRSGRRETLERLAKFFPVPVQGVVDEFARGYSNIEVCARTIHALRGLGVSKFYVSNLHLDRAQEQLEAIRECVAAL